MADHTRQFNCIAYLKFSFDALFANRNDVFVAGDLLWYPVQGKPAICTAPDVMVAFGRLTGDRGSYLQWLEDNTPPQVVFEILSPSNTPMEMLRKTNFFATYGVQEYYVFDPERVDLSVWVRQDDVLRMVDPLELPWTSPLLGINLDITADELRVFHLDGKPFQTYLEQADELKKQSEQLNKLAQKLREMGVDPESV